MVKRGGINFTMSHQENSNPKDVQKEFQISIRYESPMVKEIKA